MSDLCQLLESYLGEDAVRQIYNAYLFSAEAHEGQMRQSGEPYIAHPIAVARILAEMHMDGASICAALLHDVIEDTDVDKQEIASTFTEEIAELVDGVTKLTKIKFNNPAEEQAENFRKMMLAMVRDMRVILVKLADRLHNMRTLGALRPGKRRRIARETLEIYVPIASRLGMNHLRHELEDLGFAAYYPARYRVLAEAVKRARGHRKEIMQQIETSVTQRLESESIPAQVAGREKHLYSIYRKMRSKGLRFSDVQDVYAFRVVVDSVDSCYRALGVMHNLYKPVPGRFKDYIAIPKANGYQSLHTTLYGPYDLPIEVQIRTGDMHRVAEAGIAAHWLYKSGDDAGRHAHSRAREWLKSLLEMQQNAGNSMEFLENVKIDLFPDEVYVFSPKGEIRVLPRNATPVDYAYLVHTDLGNTCVAAKIDRRLAPLRTPLLNGQTVEIITTPVARPNPAWLNFVVTAKARSNIRAYLKNLRREDAINLGQHLLEKSLHGLRLDWESIPASLVNQLLEEKQLSSVADLYEAVGLGNQMASLAAKHIHDLLETPEEERSTEPQGPLRIKGTEGLVVNFARCCRPIPGDRILGFVSAGRGIVIHGENCRNVADFRDKPEKWIDVEWEKDTEVEFTVDIRIDVANQRGVLATIAATIADVGSNIENVKMADRTDGNNSTIDLVITVEDRRHLARLIRRVKQVPQVLRIARMKS